MLQIDTPHVPHNGQSRVRFEATALTVTTAATIRHLASKPVKP